MTANDFYSVYSYVGSLVERGVQFTPSCVGVNSRIKKDEGGNHIEISEQLFCFVVDYFLGNGTMKTVSDEDYMKIDEKQIYHGFEKIDYAARELVSHTRHYGRGVFGSGLYTTENKAQAMKYAAKDPRRLLYIKVPSEMKKSIDYKELFSYVTMIRYDDYKFRIKENNLNPEDTAKALEIRQMLEAFPDDDTKQYFLRSMEFNPSILAVMLGYNYVSNTITMNDGESTVDNDMILDRSIAVVPERCAACIIRNSEKFSDGVLDYWKLDDLNKLIEEKYKPAER